ncbi:hypothetical protein EMGBD4_15250 [Verrucomicrobiota bacterium]|nr:hypothetical protein EMGBD4_15250 [Verrucomicrobiota bacterium]
MRTPAAFLLACLLALPAFAADGCQARPQGGRESRLPQAARGTAVAHGEGYRGLRGQG